jgi:hypothetical protein
MAQARGDRAGKNSMRLYPTKITPIAEAVHKQEVTTDAGDVPAPTITTWPRTIMDGQRAGLFYRILMYGPSDFTFAIREGDEDDVALYVEEDRRGMLNAGKAEGRACAWIDDEVKRREEVAATTMPTKPLVAGWELTPGDDKDGLYKIDFVNTTTGEVGPDSYRGYMRWQDALAEAGIWARENPCDGSEPVAAPAPPDPPVEAVEAPAVEAVPVEGHAAGRTKPEDDDLVRLRQQLAAQGAELESTKKQLAGVTADICEAGAQADEATALLQEIRDDEVALKVLKDELKAKKSRFDLITGKMASHVQAVIHRKAPPSYQLTLANDKATRDSIGADAEKYAEQLNHPEKWAYNGKEYTIDVEPVATGGYAAWLRGHRAATEAPHENLAGAIEEAKNRAALLLKDAEPGEGLQPETASAATATPSTPAPAAEVKLPPKAGGKLKGRDRDGVIAVLRKSKELVHALEELTVTKLQLEKYAKKVDIDIGRTLNTAEEAPPELPPAPDEKVPARGRGGGGGQKNGRGK